MIVNVEFLGEEPIENVITCLHYAVDKVIFFGYYETIKNSNDSLKSFLRNYCGVKEVVFISLSEKDIQSVLSIMRREIDSEIALGNQLYFDITGGESLILVAFGMFSKEYDTPMHLFDIEKDQIIELNEGASTSLSSDVKTQEIQLNLDSFAELHGSKINYSLHKAAKESGTGEFMEDVEKIWDVSKQFSEQWNAFSSFINGHMASDSLTVSKSAYAVIDALSKSTSSINCPAKLNRILDVLGTNGLLENVVCRDGRYSFKYKNQFVMDCIRDSGMALELHTYMEEKPNSDDCKIGVHLDWDGIVHEERGQDVLNEIDVLSLKGNIPTFISCKSGKMSSLMILHALYELDTVAKRFGSKYAKKVLVTNVKITGVYAERAEEMGIELR